MPNQHSKLKHNDPNGGLMIETPEKIEFKKLVEKNAKLIIRNPTPKRIAFEINSTTPKRYSIKPSKSILDPGQSAKIDGSLNIFIKLKLASINLIY